MDNQSQSSQSSYDKYIAEINSRIQSDMIDIAPAEHREHLKEEIYKTELDWINTQYLKDQANSWDENQFKAEVDKIPKWTKAWNKVHAYGPNYLRYVSEVNRIIDTEFLPLVPEDRRESVREELEKQKREKMFTFQKRKNLNDLREKEVELFFD